MKRGINILISLTLALFLIGVVTGNLGSGFSDLSTITGMAVSGSSVSGNIGEVFSDNLLAISLAVVLVILIAALLAILIYKMNRKRKERKKGKKLEKKIKEKNSKNTKKSKQNIIGRIYKRRESAEKLETKHKMEEVYDLLQQGEDTLARKKWQEARELYTGLNKEDKEEIYPKAMELYKMFRE